MMEALSRDFVHAFYDAYLSRDATRIETFLRDDVEWMISGPVDLLEYYGPRHGKAAVLELITSIVPRFIELQNFEIAELLIQHNKIAAFVRLHGVQCETGRMIAYHCAHFMLVEAGKLARFHAVSDSLDAAEQMLGRNLDLPQRMKPALPEVRGEVIAL